MKMLRTLREEIKKEFFDLSTCQTGILEYFFFTLKDYKKAREFLKEYLALCNAENSIKFTKEKK
jgi:hypothetical protein